MKKLMIAAAIVCAAAFANAACITWSVTANSWSLDDGTKAAAGTTVYLIDGNTALATIAAAVEAGTIDDQDWYFAQRNTTGAVGMVSSGESESKNLTAGETYNFSTLFVDGDKYMVSDTYEQTAYAKGGEVMTAGFGSSKMNTHALTYDATTAKNGWAAVPEPTSGLLLLLGVAGLALRRRRA